MSTELAAMAGIQAFYTRIGATPDALAAIESVIERLREADRREDAASLERFCDCEALIISMTYAQVRVEQDKMKAARQAYLAADSESERARQASIADRHRSRADALNEHALAVTTFQHRIDTYDPDELSRAHQRAANTPQRASRGGKASAAKLTPEERRERATNAVNARWSREKNKP